MHIRHVFGAADGSLLAALAGPIDRSSRLDVYRDIAECAEQADAARLFVDKTAAQAPDQLDLEDLDDSNAVIATTLQRAGVKEVVFLAEDTEPVTMMLAAALRRAGVVATFAQKLDARAG